MVVGVLLPKGWYGVHCHIPLNNEIEMIWKIENRLSCQQKLYSTSDKRRKLILCQNFWLLLFCKSLKSPNFHRTRLYPRSRAVSLCRYSNSCEILVYAFSQKAVTSKWFIWRLNVFYRKVKLRESSVLIVFTLSCSVTTVKYCIFSLFQLLLNSKTLI